MSPHRRGALAYWHSGGGVESRSGPLSRRRALELFRLHAGEMLAAFERRDGAAVIFFAQVSLDIASAIVAADAWRSASAARPVRVSHENTAAWLRKS
jgi:hypothetical protein